MITLKTLAERLNVSISTVSKALHDSDEISPDTIKRVKDLATLLNYKPNRLAVNLKRNKTNTIGVIIPDILNHFFAKALFAIEKEATKQGYNIITCLSNELQSKEENSLQLLSNGSVDGFIMSIAEETQINNTTDHIHAILNQNIPIVLFDRVSDTIDCNKVIIDDFGAAYEATNHLIAEGRKTIVLVSAIDDLSVGKLRVDGYLKAIATSTNYTSEPIVVVTDKHADVEVVIHQLFEDNPHVDGILSVDNTTGVLALQSAVKLGYEIPKALSIIGFSDDNVLQFTDPKMSTLSQHTLDIGKAAVKMLIEKMDATESAESVIKTIKTNLVLRGTTK